MKPSMRTCFARKMPSFVLHRLGTHAIYATLTPFFSPAIDYCRFADTPYDTMQKPSASSEIKGTTRGECWESRFNRTPSTSKEYGGAGNKDKVDSNSALLRLYLRSAISMEQWKRSRNTFAVGIRTSFSW